MRKYMLEQVAALLKPGTTLLLVEPAGMWVRKSSLTNSSPPRAAG